MARRRMIDPNFWQSEDVSKLTLRQRLLLIGLFSNADDEGKLRGNPAFVRSAIYPYEDYTLLEIEDDLNQIEGIGSIIQYVVDASKYIVLVNWKKFQRVDKPQKSVIPNHSFDGENHSNNESENDYGLKERKLKEVKGKEVKLEEDKGADSDSNSVNEIERYFCQKRARGFDVSPADFQLIREVVAYGITTESAKISIDNCFSEYKPRHPKDLISTFSYCVARCYDDWTKMIEKLKPIHKGGEPPNGRIPKGNAEVPGGSVGTTLTEMFTQR